MAAEWSHDFCLSCDKQIAEGAYCSQSCRLADLDKANADTSSILAASYSSSTASSSYSSSASAGHPAFFLPPAVSFNSKRSSTRSDSPPTSPGYSSNRSYFSQHSSKPSTSSTSSASSDASKRTLSPSSSRSSLMSLSAGSGQAQQGLSTQAANELRGYASSFDRVRDYKRRMAGA
ncbi:hypothetical protein K490DRAFT_67294 [Saccharata proteae CBS 121410]|uniref:Life-span regulatory factor n=1 Tax=Saccharata proteae CBS 121410 TaxID=1314787 RepID=A0A9P4LYJ1_9PEZI|nr:hypothetical protein K490DRAFT_67294 [Saccharata proteae CBS 121410]